MNYLLNRRKAFREVVADYKAMYRFKDNGEDATGNNDASMSNVTYSNSGGLPSLGKYSIYNGTTSYGQVTDDADVTNIKTCCVWIYLFDFGELNVGRIIDKNASKTIFWPSGTDSKLEFYKLFDTSHGQWSSPNASIAATTWYNVAYTYAMDDNVATNPLIYINGQSVVVTEDVTPEGNMTSDTGADLYIGNRSDNQRTFNGRMDNLRIYDRVLTPTEILEIYNSEKP